MQNSQLFNDIADRDVKIYCRCLIECPDGSDNSTCLLSGNAKCFKKLYINEDGVEEVRAGCLGSIDEQIDQCNKLANPMFSTPTDLQCCNNGSLCNDHLIMSLPARATDLEDSDMPCFVLKMLLILLLKVLGLCIIFGTIVIMYCIKMKRREKKRKKQIETENEHAGCPVLYPQLLHCEGEGGHRAINDLLNELPLVAGTSSESEVPFLVQRTISKQIEIIDEIGKGRYGSVKLGRWRGEYVAMKIFNTRDEESWHRETEIYQNVLLRHVNILGFIAADISGSHSWTQLFLITDYHPNGSLYDYLQKYTLQVTDALRLALSACAGLSHLHTEISGTQGKPAIAHRDVTSKNILVKSDGECCIADMGLAVRYSRLQGRVNFGSYESSRRKGTIRYMAPEVITQSFHPDSFEPYKAADVYGFALVMWEIANRTRVKDFANDYQLPYYDVLCNDPDMVEIKKVVVIEKLRPEILPEWNCNKVMRTYVATMQECWSDRYESRLSMLRVRKTLSGLTQDRRKVSPETSSSDDDRKLPPSSSNSSASSDNSRNSLPVHSNETPLISAFEV